jgi:hypothetical protein
MEEKHRPCLAPGRSDDFARTGQGSERSGGELKGDTPSSPQQPGARTAKRTAMRPAQGQLPLEPMGPTVPARGPRRNRTRNASRGQARIRTARGSSARSGSPPGWAARGVPRPQGRTTEGSRFSHRGAEDWRMDERTRDLSRQGIASARAILASLAPAVRQEDPNATAA